MAPAATSTWGPAVATVGLAVFLLVLLLAWARADPSDPEGPDGSDPGSGGGGGGPRHPRRPPPVGPVSWTDFERDFAAYVARQVRDRAVHPRDFTRSERCRAHRDPVWDLATEPVGMSRPIAAPAEVRDEIPELVGPLVNRD